MMDKKQEQFLKELLADFQIEAEEHYVAIVNCIIGLENNPAEDIYKKTIEQAYREMHSLKGAARAVNLSEIERLCQSLESVFSCLKQRSIQSTQRLFDIIHQSMDLLSRLLADLKSGNKTVRSEQTARVIEELQSARPAESHNSTKQDKQADHKTLEQSSRQEEGTKTPAPDPSSASHSPRETVRVPVETLSQLLLKAEEFIPMKSGLQHSIKQLKTVRKEIKGKPEQGINETLKGISVQLIAIENKLENLSRNSNRMIDDLLNGVRGTLLFPFSSVLDIFPKMVRDLSRDQGKQVNLDIRGGETEIDRRILEEVKDPFIHIVRNCIDHGLEMPENRIKSGKPASGSIAINISKLDNYIEVKITDDGAGMNRNNILDKAVQDGFIPAEKGKTLSDKEVFNLALLSGLSTSRFITDLSGHGLGLAIVAEKVNLLGGALSIESQEGKGTSFIIRMPLKLATFRGILIRISDHYFLLPNNFVDSAIRISRASVFSVEDHRTIMVSGRPIPVKHLGSALDIPGKQDNTLNRDFEHAMILSSGERRMAFVVDEILEEVEGIVKNPGGLLNNARSISGASILGNGRIVPILNVPELLESSLTTRQSVPGGKDAEEQPEAFVKQQQILIAEDSITARSLLRNILESAGYAVKTAVDGLDALMQLKNGEFDLVVSDVEMPSLNGFELITRIREDKRFTDLPVILVTALESSADRQRGMDCGANAYIVKSNFEQSNLLEVIRRLI